MIIKRGPDKMYVPKYATDRKVWPALTLKADLLGIEWYDDHAVLLLTGGGLSIYRLAVATEQANELM